MTDTKWVRVTEASVCYGPKMLQNVYVRRVHVRRCCKPGWKRKEIGKTSAVAAHNDDARRPMLDFGPEKTMRAGGSPRSNGTNFWAFSGLS